MKRRYQTYTICIDGVQKKIYKQLSSALKYMDKLRFYMGVTKKISLVFEDGIALTMDEVK